MAPRHWLSLLCALLLLQHVACNPVVDDEDEEEIGSEEWEVVELTDDNYEKYLLDGNTWLLRVYNTGCATCKILSPHWEQTVSHIQEFGLPLRMAQAQAAFSDQLNRRLKIGNLPSLVLVNNRMYYHYDSTTHDKLTYIDFATRRWAEDDFEGDVGYFFKEDEPEDPYMKTLTQENFDEVTSTGKWLIFFYGARCSYCKDIMPIVRDAGKHAIMHDLGFRVAKVEGRECPQLARRFGAFPWPFLMVYENGKGVSLEDGRVARTMEQYLDFGVLDPLDYQVAEEENAEECSQCNAGCDAGDARDEL